MELLDNEINLILLNVRRLEQFEMFMQSLRLVFQKIPVQFSIIVPHSLKPDWTPSLLERERIQSRFFSSNKLDGEGLKWALGQVRCPWVIAFDVRVSVPLSDLVKICLSLDTSKEKFLWGHRFLPKSRASGMLLPSDRLLKDLFSPLFAEMDPFSDVFALSSSDALTLSTILTESSFLIYPEVFQKLKALGRSPQFFEMHVWNQQRVSRSTLEIFKNWWHWKVFSSN